MDSQQQSNLTPGHLIQRKPLTSPQGEWMKAVHHSQPGYPRKLAAKHPNRPVSILETQQRWFYRARRNEQSLQVGAQMHTHMEKYEIGP